MYNVCNIYLWIPTAERFCKELKTQALQPYADGGEERDQNSGENIKLFNEGNLIRIKSSAATWNIDQTRALWTSVSAAKQPCDALSRGETSWVSLESTRLKVNLHCHVFSATALSGYILYHKHGQQQQQQQ